MNLLNRYHLLLLFIFIFNRISYAQFDKIQKLTTKDGLSQGMIFDILKDRSGFLWFGTKNGLNRYDGYEFKVFTNDPFDTTSISGDAIDKLFEDSKGRLWVGTLNSGLNLFDKKTQTFHRVQPSNLTEAYNLDKLTVYDLFEDKKGRIWFSNREQLFRLEVFEKDGQPHFEVKLIAKTGIEDMNDFNFRVLLTSKDEILLYKMNEGIFIWNEASQRLEPYLIGSEYKAANCLMEAPAGVLWISQANKENMTLKRIENKKIVAEYTPPVSFSRSAQSGVIQVFKNPNTNKVFVVYSFHSPIYEINLDESPLENKIKKVYEGEQGMYYPKLYHEDDRTLWIGSSGYGIRKVSLQAYPFQHLEAGESIRYMRQPKDENLFFTVRNQLYTRQAGTTETISGKEYFSIKKESVYLISITSDTKGKNWLLARDLDKNVPPSKKGFLYELNEDFTIKKKYRGGVLGSTYGHFIADEKGYFWFSRFQFPGKLSSFNPELDSFHIFACTDTLLSKKNTNKVLNNHIYLAKDGTIWSATTQGLYHFKIDYEAKNCDCTLYKNNPNDNKSIRHNNIGGVLEDVNEPEKYLWVATKGGGLNRLNRQTGEFEHITMADGLPDNVVYGVLPDEEGNLWLSTNRGLSKFNPKTKRFTNFTVEDGLQDDEFNTASFYKDEKTGELFFGGINGITAFLPKEIKLKNFKPNLFFTKLKINNELVEVKKELQQRGENPLSQSIEFTKKIELAWYQNQIAIQFAALDFTIPEKNLYQYKLSSVDKDWVQADKNRTASYANLGAGHYTFRVRGSNSSGIWNEEELTLEIIISPPWWRTTLAYVIYALLIVASIWYAYQFQINRIKLQNELAFEQKEAARLADLDKIKTNFFSNITHEFRTPLTLIIEPLRQVLKNPHQNWLSKVQLARNNSERLLSLINQLLDLSKLEQEEMKVELKRGDITEVVQPIVDSFKLLAQRKDLSFRYECDESIGHFDFDKDKIEKVLFNLLSNAIKFTAPSGTVSFLLKKVKPKEIQFTIKDSGIGISEVQQAKVFDRFYQIDGSHTRSEQGTGIGLALTKELVEIMDGNIYLESESNKGSTFTVNIPMIFTENPEILEARTASILTTTSNNSVKEKSLATIPNIAPDALNVALLIEDNQELRQFIRMSIEDKYQVIEADNGKTGLELALRHIPNIIISDVMMPEMDGFTVCQNLKTDEKTAHIPVILLTAKTALDSKLKGLKYGADVYMSKPFNTEELRVRIENLITIRKKLQRKFSKTLEELIIKNVFGQTPKQPVISDDDLSSYDQNFLNNVHQVVKKRLDDETLTVEGLAKEAAMSRAQLHRKLRALLNQSPSEFIRNIRLKEAMQLLKSRKGNVTEVAFMVGFSSQKYFSTKFKEKFGVRPSEV